VRVIEGYGATIDVVLVNGVLNVGDTIVVCGLQGPIVANIRALLTPPPMREIRVKVCLSLDRVVSDTGATGRDANHLFNSFNLTWCEEIYAETELPFAMFSFGVWCVS